MGVNFYILDERSVRLAIGKSILSVGTLRRFWKITEMTAEREQELRQALEGAPQSPKAVMLAEPCEEAAIIHGNPSLQRAHLVLGWDSGRFKTTDFNWDYLPVLGYAIREPANDVYRLHEMSHGELIPIDEAHAVELQVLNQQGELIRRGQPTIAECREVRSFIDGYAQADCVLEDGRQEKFLVKLVGQALPPRGWLVGKKPMDLGWFSADEIGTSG